MPSPLYPVQPRCPETQAFLVAVRRETVLEQVAAQSGAMRHLRQQNACGVERRRHVHHLLLLGMHALSPSAHAKPSEPALMPTLQTGSSNSLRRIL